MVRIQVLFVLEVLYSDRSYIQTTDFSSQDLISAPFRCRYLSGLYGIDTPRVLASLN